jgi:hypothetical protein
MNLSGFVNDRNSCWANSLVQALVHTQPLASAIRGLSLIGCESEHGFDDATNLQTDFTTYSYGRPFVLNTLNPTSKIDMVLNASHWPLRCAQNMSR